MDRPSRNTRVILSSVHGVCLPASRLPVGEYTDVEPIVGALHQPFGIFKYFLLGSLLREHLIEHKCLPFDTHTSGIQNGENRLLFSLHFFTTYRPYPTVHPNVPFKVFDLVMELTFLVHTDVQPVLEVI